MLCCIFYPANTAVSSCSSPRGAFRETSQAARNKEKRLYSQGMHLQAWMTKWKKIREQFVTPFNRQFLSFLAVEEELHVIRRLIFNGPVWKTTTSSSSFQGIFILVVAFSLITLLPDRLLWSRRLLFLLFYFNFALSSFRGYVWACWPPMCWSRCKKSLE